MSRLVGVGRSRRPLVVGFIVVSMALMAAVAFAVTRPGGAVAATYANPVIRTDFADPAVIRGSGGWYYAYSTEQLTVDRMAYIQVARSRDLLEWELLRDALTRKPAWTRTTRDFWAPGIIEADGRAFLYYAGWHDNGDGMCLGVAVADDPAGPFEPSDTPIHCDDGYVAIDVFPYDDPTTGKRLLYWGSDGAPIFARELAPDRISFMPGSEATEVFDRNVYQPFESLIEAPWVIKRGEMYYLFVSAGNCCARPAGYAVLVARSTSATGPFESRAQATDTWGASVILRGNDVWEGPGHNAVVADGAGQDWLIYHAIDPHDPFQPAVDAVKRPMLIDRISWVDGWPGIANDSPSSGPQPAPIP